MILPNLQNKTILLASASPRRKELLAGIGLDFTVYVKKDIPEDFDYTLPAEKVAEYLAAKKADNYQDVIDDKTIVITADTIVVSGKQVLNKPQDRDDASKMLNTLSDSKHKVITGVCVSALNKKIVFSAETTVCFSKLTNDEIDYYIETYKPYDKAGAYGIQEWIGFIGINKIEGSYFNVMGLPVHLIYSKLKLF